METQIYIAHFHVRERRRGKRMCYWRPVRKGELAIHLYWPVDFKSRMTETEDGR